MNFFRYTYPDEPAYKWPIFAYSKGWHGTVDLADPDAVVDAYNDQEGYLIGHTPNKVVDGLEPITEAEANKILASLTPGNGVYFGESLENRVWDWRHPSLIPSFDDSMKEVAAVLCVPDPETGLFVPVEADNGG